MYRILTDDVNRNGIFAILDRYVDGYTVTPSIGAWKGQRENSLAIDLVDVPRGTVENIARVIRWENQQESVLILELPSVHGFIDAAPNTVWVAHKLKVPGIFSWIDGARLTRNGNPV
jgi:hypothetical protein